MSERKPPECGYLTVTFAGIVSYVSEPCRDDRKWIFMPNATNQLDVGYPDVLHTPHEPRILINVGKPCAGWDCILRCMNHHGHSSNHYDHGDGRKDYCADQEARGDGQQGDGSGHQSHGDGHRGQPQTVPGKLLARKHVEIQCGVEEFPLCLDGSLADLPNLQELVELVEEGTGTRFEPLPEKMFENYDGDELLARFLISGGRLSVGGYWKIDGKTDFSFEDTLFGQRFKNAHKLAMNIFLKVPLEDEACAVKIALRDLADETKGVDYLEVLPVNGVVHLTVENAPVTPDGVQGCHSSDPHFAAHYVLRPGYDKAVWVLVPELIASTTGSNDNAQCSPVRDSG